MDGRRLTTRASGEAIALARVFRAPRAGLRVLMYHAVGSPALGDEKGIFGIAPDLFEAHMAALARYENATVTTVSSEHPGDSLMKVVITFDDGYGDNLHTAAPILERYSFPFTVFAVSEFVRKNASGFLSAAELRSLSARPGVTIGSHGASHIHLTQCEDKALKDELMSSKHYLEDIIGKPVSSLAYPYGAVNRKVRDAAENAGYSLGFTSHFDINGPKRDPLLLARVTVLGIDCVRVFEQKLHGDWDWYQWRARDPAAL